jgi:Trk-type K+ transport system membrane component
MNYTAISNVLGKLLIVTGASMVLPLICSLYYGEDDLHAIAVSGLITIGMAVFYFIVNIFLVRGGGGCFMTLVDPNDYATAMSSVISTLINIGPGFGAAGPSENHAHISVAGKWFLSSNMLVGRLEMFSALVIFYPSFWKR